MKLKDYHMKKQEEELDWEYEESQADFEKFYQEIVERHKKEIECRILELNKTMVELHMRGHKKDALKAATARQSIKDLMKEFETYE
jgi:hypothetical protein